MNSLNRGRMACAVCALCVMAAGIAHAQTFETLVSFALSNGGKPTSGLVQGMDGNLYGTTEYGGVGGCSNGCGTVFKVTTAGVLTTLYFFCSQTDCEDGSLPYAGLVEAANGNFYGTTSSGGAGSGTAFKITASGTLTSFEGFDSTNGTSPYAGLVQAANGNFYGTASSGGLTGSGCGSGCGTVFKITPSGMLTTVQEFAGSNGSTPYGSLVQGADGSFYGTTEDGGAGEACYPGEHGNGCGTVFKVTSTGTLTTLYSFCTQTNCPDGWQPWAGLVQATDGNFYGTTSGAYLGSGTVFKITSAGTLTTLYSFCSQPKCTDGDKPYGGLVQGTDGNFYGTTYEGGTNGAGTVFEITPTGTLTTLHSFDGTDGEEPLAGLVQATNGSFYGTTTQGGTNPSCTNFFGCGTIFSLSVGLGPFVETLPTSGKGGAVVKILGTNLTGATSVTFNGTAATFKVVSPSLITTAVPAGATTGEVQVVTPGGTLSSNVPFHVLP